MSLPFRELTLADKELVLRYTRRARKQNCDLSFANLFGWQQLYRTEIAEWDGFLYCRFYADGHLAYMVPLGDGDLMQALKELKYDACGQGRPLLLLGVDEDDAARLRQFEDGDYLLNANRAYADYIYLRSSLADLSGKKLQAKRNHANRFRRMYPQYEYRPLTRELVPLCLELDTHWADGKTEEREQRAVGAETEAIKRVLTHFEELDVIGGTIFVDNRLVAFTYGAPINEETFDVCVEKADVSYEGAYAIINQEFAKHLPEQYIYLNREEDLGIEGLRKTKLAYQPVRLLEKMSLWSTCSAMKLYETEQCSPKSLYVKWQTRALWKLCFNDSDDFIRLYFSQKYRTQYNTYRMEEGRVIAALQRLPYILWYRGECIPVGYISGACTCPEYRGRGIMGELLKEAHKQMYQDGKVFSMLIPANVGLFHYYNRFGYTDCMVQPSPSESFVMVDDVTTGQQITVFRSMSELENVDTLQDFLEKNMKLHSCAMLHDEDDWKVVLSDLFLAEGVLVVEKGTNQEIKAMMLAVVADSQLRVLEYVGREEDYKLLVGCAFTSLNLPQNTDVFISRTSSQVRVLNVERSLTLYAQEHPDVCMKIRVVGDDCILENNGIYRLEGGVCVKMPMGSCCAECIQADHIKSIKELSEWLFADGLPHMSLMLN